MKIFESQGFVELIEDAEGKKSSSNLKVPVYATAYYNVTVANEEALSIKLYGTPKSGFIGFGSTIHRLTLENGLTFRGRLRGGGWYNDTAKMTEVVEGRLYDLQEQIVQLYPHDDTESSGTVEVDGLVFPLAASNPLGHGMCTSPHCFVTPGKPLTIRDNIIDRLGVLNSQVLKIEYNDLLIIIAPTNRYWSKYFDVNTGHQSIGGIRSLRGEVLDWNCVNETLTMLQSFLGWINHCRSPVTVVRGYRRRKLVYRGFRVRPDVSSPRDRYSWLPWHLDPEKDSEYRSHGMSVQALFHNFARTWDRNVAENGTFHLALQFLRSNERGALRNKPSILYFQHCFTALGISLRDDESMRRGK